MRLAIVIGLYVFLLCILLVVRPTILFNHDGSLKRWGTDIQNGESIYASEITFIVLAVACYFIVLIGELVMG